jgi:hypothetical protein
MFATISSSSVGSVIDLSRVVQNVGQVQKEGAGSTPTRPAAAKPKIAAAHPASLNGDSNPREG